MNIVIDNLIIVGNIANSGHSGIAVTLWGSSNFNIYGLTVNNVDVSGFTRGGISSYRKPGSGFISNVVISNSAFHDNPGYSNTYAVQGSGIVMAGVQYCTVSNVKAYNNGGAVNTSPGPIGTWFFDADHVTVSDSSFYNNLSQGPDGGGVDFDCGTTNSVFQRVSTWNNWGAGFAINSCSSGQGYNNDGSSMNIVMQNSTSYGDSYRRKDCLLCIWADTNTVASNILFQDMTLTANGYGMLTAESGYSFYSNQYNVYQILGLWTYGQMSQIATRNVQFIFDSTIYAMDLNCNGLNPTCDLNVPTAPPSNVPSAPPSNMPIAAPTSTPSLSPTNKPIAPPTSMPTTTPTTVPTATPTSIPVAAPTKMPTVLPTGMPIPAPTKMPTASPTIMPLAMPTAAPTLAPTVSPINKPTAPPTSTPFLATLGINAPSPTPTLAPVAAPAQSSTGGRSFYVSSVQSSASDSNPGTSASSPWRTLAKVIYLQLYISFHILCGLLT